MTVAYSICTPLFFKVRNLYVHAAVQLAFVHVAVGVGLLTAAMWLAFDPVALQIRTCLDRDCTLGGATGLIFSVAMMIMGTSDLFVVSKITPQEFCSEVSGHYDSTSSSCTLEHRSDGVQPSCFRAAAQKLFSDEHGPCYEFMRTENGHYRQRYRLSETCWRMLPQFQQTVTAADVGICANIASWSNNPGTYIPQAIGTISSSKPLDPRNCRVHRSQSRCESDLCDWSASQTYVPCAPGQDCQNACYAMGGDMHNGECVVPKCRPKVASEKPCD